MCPYTPILHPSSTSPSGLAGCCIPAATDACSARHSHTGRPQLGGFFACCVLVFGFFLVSSTFVQGLGCFGADFSEAHELLTPPPSFSCELSSLSPEFVISEIILSGTCCSLEEWNLTKRTKASSVTSFFACHVTKADEEIPAAPNWALQETLHVQTVPVTPLPAQTRLHHQNRTWLQCQRGAFPLCAPPDILMCQQQGLCWSRSQGELPKPIFLPLTPGAKQTPGLEGTAFWKDWSS